VGWAATDANGAPIFGRRNVNNISQTLTGTYTFTPRMSLSLRLRHYSLSTQYKEYYRINDNGEWTKDAQYSDTHNLSFNAFNLDCVYKWEFTPGSFLSIVWKNAISDFQPLYIPSYINNIRHTFDVPQVNSLSARVVYFMDAQMFRKKKLVKVG
jgi:hypothetical protein